MGMALAASATIEDPFRLMIPDLFYQAQEALRANLPPNPAAILAQGVSIEGRVGPENVVGHFIGYKQSDNGFTGELAIIVMVREKVTAPSRIDSSSFIEPVIRVGREEVPTDVVAVGDLRALQFRDRQGPPAMAGSSIGLDVASGNTGTFGCLVVVEGKRCILSNAHVLTEAGQAQVGTGVLHPGLADSPRNQTYVIAEFLKSAPLTFGGVGRVDAAVAWTSRDVALANHRGLFTIRPDFLEASIDVPVKKAGRTTGLTFGSIKGVSGNITIGYGPNGSAPFVEYRNQIVIRGGGGNFSEPGDSGSLVVHSTSNHPIGLLFAGGGGFSFANPIREVRDTLGIEAFVNSND